MPSPFIDSGKRNKEQQPQVQLSTEQKQLAKQQFEKLTEAASSLMDSGELDVYSQKKVRRLRNNLFCVVCTRHPAHLPCLVSRIEELRASMLVGACCTCNVTVVCKRPHVLHVWPGYLVACTQLDKMMRILVLLTRL